MEKPQNFSGITLFTRYRPVRRIIPVIILTILFIASGNRSIKAQAEWEKQDGGVEITLGGVFLTGMNSATVVGYDGTILQTADGGENWESRTSGSEERLWGVWFSDPQTGTAVGGNGTILRTTDGGESWVPQASGTDRFLYRVYFRDENTGFIVGSGGTMLHTTDGGENWAAIDLETTNGILDISFGSADHGIATGQGLIYNTDDGGATWTNRTPEGTGGRLIYGVFLVDETTGMAVVGEGSDDGYVLKTTDGGMNWEEVVRTGFFPRDVFMITDEIATVVGNFGILKTTDGGETWTDQDFGMNDQNLYGLFFHDEHNGVAVGTNGSIFWLKGQATSIADADKGSTALPEHFYLEQNYPNPFNPVTVIRYGLPVSSRIDIDIINVSGQKILDLEDGIKPAGFHSITFDASRLSSGVYICRITAGRDVRSLKMTLLK